MKISIPELCLVVLMGPSGSGKSTLARKHFAATEVISSDYCRGLVSDDENSMDATNDAFDVLRYVAGKRLERGRLTVIDATNVQPESRKPLLQMAFDHDVLPVVIVLNLPERVCHARNTARPDRDFGPHVVRNQHRMLRQSLRRLEREGFRYVHVLHSEAEVLELEIERQKLWNDRKSDHGPFDIVGDVHGCFDELIQLLEALGYDTTNPDLVVPPGSRKLIFLGDLVDRGPGSVEVLKLARSMVQQGTALCVPGNHDVKLLKKLRGKNVQLTHGLAETVQQLEAKCTADELVQFTEFIDSLVGHYVLDEGRLVVAHAGMKAQYIGRASRRVREFALFGETTGETDEFGLPVRYNWAAEYRGNAHVVYGHTPVPEADWLNGTINIDTGCVFGGKLTALRWPEKEIVSVPARREYAVPARPINTATVTSARSAQQVHDDLLDIDDVRGKRVVQTRLHATVTVREENAIAALEVMSRFAIDPKWLIYLPPTMSPTETSEEPGLLEHPRQAFEYFHASQISKVICEEKHMGSRAVAIVCRENEVAARRFGVLRACPGVIYTRTGRRFFDDAEIENSVLTRLRDSLGRAGLWDELTTDWVCLDCELMPWSAKAQELLKSQYAAVGSAATSSLCHATSVVQTAIGNAESESAAALSQLRDDLIDRQLRAERYVAAYQHYCWPVNTVEDLRLAPFHLLASEGAVFSDRPHDWHMTTLARLADHDPIFVATPFRIVETGDSASVEGACDWWKQLTAGGGEGMVVKPLDFAVRGTRGLIQPAIKCRGPEYLRIIYGPEYDRRANLERLRSRQVRAKRSLALREFALGIEGLERFVRQEPLRSVHECVFAVLALESEPVDPRL